MVKDSASRRILLSDTFEFLTVGLAKSEIEYHKQEIMDKAKVTEEESNKIDDMVCVATPYGDAIALSGTPCGTASCQS